MYCSKCWNPSTRPRITFDENGVCNACTWSEKKKTIDWEQRKQDLQALFDKLKEKQPYVIVPYSGGKDSVYVAWKMKELGAYPLLVTLEPHLETEVGKYNRELLRKDFDCITITPEYEYYRRIAIDGFVNKGRPKKPFVIGITTAVLQLAVKWKVPLIMYGEEGEAEYGGASDAKERIDRDYLINYYYSGEDPAKYGSWWCLPKDEDLAELYPTHYSKFENWNPKLHGEFAVSKGMRTQPQIATFTDYSQLSDKLQSLHAYMMFVKFGFGRCTSDVGIAIRAGEMTRAEGLKYIREYDDIFPEEHLTEYLRYFNMSEQEFWDVVNTHANKEILRPNPGSQTRPWVLKKPIGAPSLQDMGKVYG